MVMIYMKFVDRDHLTYFIEISGKKKKKKDIKKQKQISLNLPKIIISGNILIVQ